MARKNAVNNPFFRTFFNYKVLSFFLLLISVPSILILNSLWQHHPRPNEDAHTPERASPLHPDYTSPYGLATYGTDMLTHSGLITSFRLLGVFWWRWQWDWRQIEVSPRQYDWSTPDSIVALANANHIHLDFAIQNAPRWHLTQSCNGQAILPRAVDMAQFATLLATRYNGQNGHGYIDSYEIGNEEFDNYWNIDQAHSAPCRAASYYGPVLKAGYQAIKAASPQAMVGMFGLWWEDTAHIHNYLQWLYRNGYGQDFDYANFHYYICNRDPSVISGSQPSFDSEWQTIHTVMSQNGDGNKPIWVTEVGWTISSINQEGTCSVTPQTQADYLNYVLTEAKNSHVVAKVFWYTLRSDTDGMNILPPSGPLPAYTALQTFINQYPQWE